MYQLHVPVVIQFVRLGKILDLSVDIRCLWLPMTPNITDILLHLLLSSGNCINNLISILTSFIFITMVEATISVVLFLKSVCEHIYMMLLSKSVLSETQANSRCAYEAV